MKLKKIILILPLILPIAVYASQLAQKSIKESSTVNSLKLLAANALARHLMAHFQPDKDNFTILVEKINALATIPEELKSYAKKAIFVHAYLGLPEPRTDVEDSYLKLLCTFTLNKTLFITPPGQCQEQKLRGFYLTNSLGCLFISTYTKLIDTYFNSRLMTHCYQWPELIPLFKTISRFEIDSESMPNNYNDTNFENILTKIVSLPCLEELFINNTMITKISSCINQALKVKHLNLNGNQLTKIPDEIKQLERIVHITLRNNQFSQIPAVILELPNLKRISISYINTTHKKTNNTIAESLRKKQVIVYEEYSTTKV